MTWFSLKRTLQYNLASKIDVLYRNNQGNSLLNLHTPVRSSETLLSIGKITKICHQDIPVKRVSCNGIVTYFSVIPLKAAIAWQLPTEDVASVLLSRLENHTSQAIWSSVRKTDQSSLEFVMAKQGIQRWQYQLYHNGLSPLIQRTPPSINTQILWQLQSGYERCFRWSASHPTSDYEPYQGVVRPFVIPVSSLGGLIDALLDICDIWDSATSAQLLRQARKLVLTLDQCLSNTRPASSDAAVVSPWIKITQIVLKQLLHGSWGYLLAERF